MIIGIPFLKEGHLNKIEKIQINGNQFHNFLVNKQGMTMFYERIGVPAPYNFDEAVRQIGYLSEALEISTGNVVFKTLNDLNDGYGILSNYNRMDEALADKNYYNALFYAVRMIPAVDDVLEYCESVFSLVYSEAFMTALYNSSETQLRLLANCSNCQDQKNDLIELQNIADRHLIRLKEEKLDGFHNRICTCH